MRPASPLGHAEHDARLVGGHRWTLRESREADRAREFYASADELIPYVSEDSQPALWVLVTIYRRLLEKIAEKQYDVFTAKVSLTTSEKLRILAQGFLKRIV